MKKLSLVLVIAMLLAGLAAGAISTPADAQGYPAYSYPAPPRSPYANPWVGPNTPWVHYNGDWFLNGMLYYFFGPRYGWAPYYAYAPTYIVRPNAGTDRSGMPGIKEIRTTGKVSSDIIPIGAATTMLTITTGNFMRSTTMARAGVGIKDSSMGATK